MYKVPLYLVLVCILDLEVPEKKLDVFLMNEIFVMDMHTLLA